MMGRVNIPTLVRLYWTVFLLMFLGMTAKAQSPDSVSLRLITGRTFIVAPSFTVAGSPTSVAAGDLNGDGIPDLVITKAGSNSVTVLLGNGDGGFAAGATYNAGTQPGHVQLADLNGDGRLDAAVTDAATGNVDVLFGNGDGTLSAPTANVAIANPVGLAVGNFYGSGKIDLAAASAKGVVVLHNDGTGHFSAAPSFAIGSEPSSLIAADLNHSGHDDLVLANLDGTVSVMMGDGAGQFSALSALAVGSGALSAVASGDFNGDGIPDLAVTQATSGSLAVLLGRGDGSFQIGTSYSVGNAPSSVVSADWNGDGIPDLVAVNRAANTFSVLLGNGDGSFHAAKDYVAGNAPLAVVAGDFNGDGKADLAIANYQGGTISVPLGRGDGSFVAAPSYAAGLERKAIASGDLNGDGLTDLVVTNYCGSDSSCTGAGSVNVFLANPNRTYSLANTYAVGGGPVAVALADMNGDGKLDLLTANRNDKSLTVMLGNGGGSFGQAQTFSLPASPSALFVGDFNGDGRPDLAVAADCGLKTCTQNGALDVLLGRGDGTFAASASYPVGFSPVSIASGDLLGNGRLDLVVANACGEDSSCSSTGTATVLAGDGTGKFVQTGEISIGKDPSSIALAKLGGSGVDLIVAQRGSNQVSVMPGDGSGGFGAPVSYAVGSAPSALAIADLNGDGVKDVAVANFQSSTVSVLYETGSGTLQSPVSYTVGTGPESMAVVSSTNTGTQTLVTANGNTGATPMGNSITALASPTGTTASSTSLMSSASTFAVDQTVTLTATVTGATTPTGNVVFAIDNGTSTTSLSDCGGATGTALGAASATSSMASCDTQLIPAGNPVKVQAQYLGDATYAASTSSDTNLHVSPADTIARVTSSPTTGFTVDEPITFTTAVLPTPAPTVTDDIVPFTGTVAFSGASISGCSTQPTSNQPSYGYAYCATSALPAGSSTISGALNSDDPNYNATTSGNITTETLTVAAANTKVTVNSTSPASPTVDEQVSITATVAPSSATATIPVAVPFAGTMSFYLDGSATAISGCGTATVGATSGQATCTISAGLLLGAHTITATYNAGDDNYNTSSSSTFNVTVGKAATTTSVSASPTSAPVNQSVTLTATVAPNVTAKVGNTSLATMTGTVSFATGGTTISGCDSQAVTFSSANGNATATCITTALPGGANSITATYAGDANYLASPASSATTVTVSKASTTTAVASSSANDTSNVNDSVTFTATVTASAGASVPLSGMVTFKDNGTNIAACGTSGAVTVSGWDGETGTATATCSTTKLIGGNHTIVATYGNDTSYSGSNNNLTQTVTPLDTTTTASANPTSASVNQSVTLSATVAPHGQAVALTGPVTFKENNQAVPGCTVTWDATTGSASCSTTQLTKGSHTITATYPSDASYNSSNADATVSVTAATATMSLTTSNPQATVNSSIKFTASFTVSNGGTKPQGAIDFTYTPSGSETATDISNCSSVGLTSTTNGGTTTYSAQCTTSSLTNGTYTITGTYINDSNFNIGSATVQQTVGPAASMTQVTSSSPTSQVNQSVSFTATVSSQVSGSTTPAGTVTFTDTYNSSTTTICSQVSISSGVYVCASASLAAGAHTITATFNPSDSNFQTSSGNVAQTVNAASSSIGLTASQPAVIVKNPSNVNDAVTFTAMVKIPNGANKPTGDVTFTYNGSNMIADCVNPAPVDASGVATCSTSLLPAGMDTVIATYNGDKNFNSSNFSVSVAVQDYSLGVSGLTDFNGTPSAFVTQGHTTSNDPFTPATISVTPTSIQGFASSAVAFSCTVEVVSAASGSVPPTCTFTPSTVSIVSTGTQPTASVMVDATNANTAPGLYSVAVTGTDSITGLARSATFDVFVFAGPVSIVSGSTTGNTTTAFFPLPANVSLSSVHCADVAGPGHPFPGVPFSGGYSSEYSIGCTVNPTSIPGSPNVQNASVTVTITTGGTSGGSSSASAAQHTNMWLAGLLGIPLFGLVGLLRGRKSPQSLFFRLIAIAAICLAGYQMMGCGGSFQKPPSSGGQTPPGAYTLTITGTGSDGNTYQAILHVNITL